MNHDHKAIRITSIHIILQCVDPSTSCHGTKNTTSSGSDSEQSHRVALTAQQLILRGPLRVIQPVKTPPHEGEKSSGEDEFDEEYDKI